MLRSLFTGISGLQVHQDMLDVTANNIANVNTTGFKSSSVVFADALSETLKDAAGSTNNTGGTNAQQIGLGVRLAGTAIDMSQGSTQTTGVPTDLLITGDGFFAVQKNGQKLYTRAGSFHIDNSGNLVTPDGAFVLGTNIVTLDAGTGKYVMPNGANPAVPAATPGPINLAALLQGAEQENDAGNGVNLDAAGNPVTTTFVSYSIAADGAINAIDSNGNSHTLAQIELDTFSNPNGLKKVGDTEFQQTAASGAPNQGIPGDGAHGTITAGALEASNVDLTQQLTDLIIAERGFQANSKSVTTADQILQTLVNLKQ